jgi:uncharacterized MAPEG superfamily protein
MTIAELMVLVAALIPYVTVGFAKGAKDFDNADPRNITHLHGVQKRAYNAQLNGYEIFPFFAVAIIFAEFKHTPQLWIDVLAVVFILLRGWYTWAYLKDKASLRSSVFSLGLLIPIVLLFLPLI